MKNISTLFLRGVVALMAVGVIAFCIFLVPDSPSPDPNYAYLKYPALAYIYIGTIPFFIALYHTLKLLHYIDTQKAFTSAAVRAVRTIKYCAFSIIGLIFVGELFVTLGMQGDRAHLVALGMYITFATTIVATFAAVVQKVLQQAVDIKSENDLTV